MGENNVLQRIFGDEIETPGLETTGLEVLVLLVQVQESDNP
jgi:hypothetical protein